MSLIRNETQTALGQLHIALQHSADCYRHTAEFLDDASVGGQFIDIAAGRERLAARVAEAIRATGDLPSEPDPDRETGEQLLSRLRSLFSADQVQEVTEQRLEADRELAAQLDGGELAVLEDEYGPLMADCREAVKETIAALRRG
ncbi:hypothetical protein [Microbulbifer litoralis]|uniref:hypothetical protein n=1 Tax=Microbulbifer litoralis TaxID=2933965 RepID=UPI002028AB3C|nr:hypothetical protein [Microbulbifer sp. GX H0434]